MPEFSLEFWIGSGIALVCLLLGFAVGVAMDTKTKGEFRFVVGCFLASSLVTFYGIGAWEMAIAEHGGDLLQNAEGSPQGAGLRVLPAISIPEQKVIKIKPL